MEEVQNSTEQQVAPDEQKPIVNEAEQRRAEKEAADERNWKAMRIKNADLERQIREQKEMMDKLLQMQQAKPELDEFDSISDDEFIPKGKVKALAKKEAQRQAEEIAKREVEKVLHQRDQNQFMDKLTKQFSDFNDIVNPETLSLLEEKDPELAKTIIDLKDPYKIGLQSYKYIKAMGLVQVAPEARREKEIEKKLEKAEKAVPSPASFDKRPIAQAFQLTDAMKKELYLEMNRYASMASSVPEMT